MSDPHATSKDSVELPAQTAWPLVLGLGIVLIGTGFGTSIGFLIGGLIVFVAGLGGWIFEMLPGQGHVMEPLVPLDQRARLPEPAPGSVQSLKPGSVGYRFRLPERVHPISSGAKGGLVGGLLMTIPALHYGIRYHDSPWLPINLLAGMVIPGLTDDSFESLKQFNLLALILGTVIHFTFSLVFGLMYGVILPMLPSFRGAAILFGGIIMPIIWTGVCYGLMGIVDPLLEKHVSWPWFILSQFVYGLAMSQVVHRSEKIAVKQRHPRKSPSSEGAH